MRFHATLVLHGKTATGMSVPEDVVTALGAGKRPPVRVTINGYTYRTTIAPMGGEYLIGVSAEHRAAAGVAAGEEHDVDVELDTDPREVEVPEDLAAALAVNRAARDFFDTLSNSNKSAYTIWVADAKKEDTRRSRVEKAVEMLAEGRRR
ncbi:MAG TPA: YdeI/OmpD-associated family protein [Micromonosporaceae bacterium]|nr:YdeI/OmpD-associated family protein [Micromonosporaceae bacterium]